MNVNISCECGLPRGQDGSFTAKPEFVTGKAAGAIKGTIPSLHGLPLIWLGAALSLLWTRGLPLHAQNLTSSSSRTANLASAKCPASSTNRQGFPVINHQFFSLSESISIRWISSPSSLCNLDTNNQKNNHIVK